MGGFAFLLAYLSWPQALLLAAGALLHNLFLLPLYARKRVFRGDAGASGRDLGIVLYPASIALLILVFRHRLEIVAAAWGLLAFGDGFATIVGRTISGARLPWNRAKSWSGLIAFFAFGCPAALILYAWTLKGHGALGDGVSPSLVLMIAVTAFLAAVLESLPLGVDDNALVPLASAGLLYSLSLFDPTAWAAHRDGVAANLPWAIGINVALAAAAYAARTVGLSGVVAGIALGGCLYAFGGWRAFLMLVGFFVLGTATTKLGYAKKAALGIAQEKGGRRGAKNAVANCGVGALLAYLAATTDFSALMMLGLVAAFATAACDTVSSEVGQAYGRTPYLITTFRRVPPGTDGAVSLEGTLAGIAGAAVVALVALALGLVTTLGAGIVVLAAFFGSTLESVMGATWERSKLIDNEAINFANTLAGALFAMGTARLIPSVLAGLRL
jgi:uncharacterized protein (TIGR00297 family)